MDTTNRILGMGVFRSQKDGQVKIKIIFKDSNNELQQVFMFSTEKAEQFINQTVLPEDVDLASLSNQLNTAYGNISRGVKDQEIIHVWQFATSSNAITKTSKTPKTKQKNSKSMNNNVKLIKTSKMGDIIIHKFGSGDDMKAVTSATERLKRAYPGILPDQADVNWFISKVFPSKLKQHCVVRNQAYILEKGKESFVVPRADIYCINSSSIFNVLNQKQMILFSGNIKSGEFVVDDIRIINNPIFEPEDKELDATFYIGSDDGKGKTNFLKSFTSSPTKGSESRANEIQEWDRYLDWKNELAKLRIQALKYIAFCFDLSEETVSFLVAFSDSSIFEDFKKYLKRDGTSIFSNQYSSNRFFFQLNKTEKSDTSADYDSGIHLDYIYVGKPFPVSELYEEKWTYSRSFAKKYYKQGSSEEMTDLSLNSLIEGVERESGAVMLAEVKFGLSDDATEWIHYQIKKNGMLPNDAEKKLSREFYSDGFIATSQIGDFALIKRLKRGISDYKSGNMASSNLAKWLFNIKNASPIIDYYHVKKWQNKKLNDKQKQAVEKILSATDVCLIQGPPGTGKTTVIAEAIYQLVVQHKRVLVASQANLAVDNALERLISNPKIRAIRLGNERKIDSSVSNITERNVLQNFYSTLVDYMDREYLNIWEKSEKSIQELDDDINYVEKVFLELGPLLNERDKVKKSLERIEKEFDYKRTKEIVNKYEEDKQLFKGIVDYCAGNSLSFDMPTSDEYASEVVKAIAFNLQSLRDSHLLLSSVVSESTSRRFCQEIIKSTVLACKLLEKMHSTDDSITLARLKAEEESLLEKMESDVSLVQEWQAVRNRIKQVSETKRSIALTTEEEALFDISISRISNSELKDTEILRTLDNAKLDIDGILNTVIQTARKYNQRLDDRIVPLKNRMCSFEEETKQLKEHFNRFEAAIYEKQAILDALCKKYGYNNEDLLDGLNERKKELKTRLISMARREDWESIFVGFKEWVRNIPDYNSERNLYLDSYINGCNVVGVSCTESSRTLLDRGFKDFDVVIIDEVSKATPPELLLSMLKGQKIVLVGDHRQLPPLFNEHEHSYQEVAEMQSEFDDVAVPLTMEDFEKYKGMVTSSLFQKYFESADSSIKETLTYQYRMHSDIMDIVNTFYDGFLEDGNIKTKTGEKKLHNIAIDSLIESTMIVPDKHAYWIDSSELNGQTIIEQREEGSTSIMNIVEAYAIRELLRKMEVQYSNDESRDGNPVSVGVISFYALQVAYIRRLIQKESFHAIDVEVNTVDRFQGKEKEVILVSLVRNKQNVKHTTDAFIASFQRINVAFSRAQNLLIIVGAKNMYADQPVVITNMNDGSETISMAYREIIEKLYMNGAFFSVDDIIPEQTANEVLEEYNQTRGSQRW